MRHPRSLALAVALAVGALLPAAAADMPSQDIVKGAKDHPLLSRFEGARLVGYDRKEFEEATFPAGKHTGSKDGKPTFEKTIRLEGRYTRLAYNYPRDRSSLEVMRNVELQLNVENLFGAQYFPTANADNNIAPGAPRTAKLTLGYRF